MFLKVFQLIVLPLLAVVVAASDVNKNVEKLCNGIKDVKKEACTEKEEKESTEESE